MSYDVCRINLAKLDEDTNLPLIQATVPVTSDDDYESFGEVASYQALGLTSLPFGPTEAGAAEGVVLRDVGALNGAIVGARDERCANVVAAMKAGDTVLHSCDPEAKAQVRCHANRLVALVTEGTDKKTMMLALDGGKDKIQIAAFGGIIELSPDGISIVAPGGKASILMQGEQITILGKLQLGGIAPTATLLAVAPLDFAAMKAALLVLGVNIMAASGVTTTGT